VGRKKLPIDPEQVKELARIGCSKREVAIHLGCSEDTIERRFAGFFQLGKVGGKIQLRRRQHERAIEGSDSMLMFLGKHRLKQIDKSEEKPGFTLADVVLEAEERARKLKAERESGGST
jgi:hypothetical protein